ncbi:hypothetical protein ILUMI_22780 [Ignelater luminosus]|uniref:Uncharacterized protein n=1 Tax=Ignelater luminosus TaxID=2038154 RepID=A0A8K0G079_IGNLU|nr:hypothetical protein ILUMI_22780 [Ignelater luminosus]
MQEIKGRPRLKERIRNGSTSFNNLKRGNEFPKGENEKIIAKRNNDDVVSIKYYCDIKEVHGILEKAHKDTGHKRRLGMEKEIARKLQKTAGDNIKDRPSDECSTELLNNDNTNNSTNEKNLQHNSSINQPEYDNVEEKLLKDNETRLISINQYRSESIKSLKKQAAEMLQQTRSKYSKVEIGQNVLVKIADVDRGRLTPRNILAVVLSEREDLYQLGTSTGVLEKLSARNEFQVHNSSPSQTTTLASSDIPIDKKFSLRTVAPKESNSAQGFLRCNCRKQENKKCNCVLNQIKCNSKCHSTTFCCNK